MNLIKSIFSILIFFIIMLLPGLELNASNSFSGLETQITYQSNTTKIKKMQLALKEFWLYSGEIDWKYESVKNALLNYQKKTGLIKNDSDYWAGYFWVQTLKSLKEDFPDKFDEITKKYLQIEKPKTNIRYFIVTAYYSPLPNQKRYTTWTYYWDIRLNWNWKKTASWKKVFEWIVAAPRNYSFWTKIEFEWLWVWVVEDRWWAIVNSGERGYNYDRIDIWMWYGDEWLERALKWWKRKVKWKIVPESREISIKFDKSIVSKYKWLKVDAEKPKKDNVIKLQSLFSDLWLYNWEINWNYNDIKNILIKFQIDNKIIVSPNSPHAWYFWDKTYKVLRKKYWWWIFKKINNKLDKDVALSKEVREKLDRIHLKINNIIEKKYWKNTLRASIYRNKLRLALNKHAKKINNNLRKKQLIYLKSLI